MYEVYQEPWEEQLPQQQSHQSQLGGIMKELVKTWAIKALTGGVGGGNPGALKNTPPGAEGMAIRAPWGQDNQKFVDSFGSFFDKLENPALKGSFAKILELISKAGAL